MKLLQTTVKCLVLLFSLLFIISGEPVVSLFAQSCTWDTDCDDREGQGQCYQASKQCNNGTCQYTFNCPNHDNECPGGWTAWGTCTAGFQRRSCLSRSDIIQIRACGANGPREYNYVYGPDCPAGTRINTNRQVSRFCYPGEVFPGWRPADDRYVMGSAQRTGTCCNEVESPIEWGPWYPCKSGNGNLCRDKIGGGEKSCLKYYTVTYACDPVAPPVAVTSTVQTSGETYGCSATAGYIGRNANNTLRISVTTPQTYASGTATDIRLWAGPAPLASENFSSTTTQALDTNNHFGLVVKKVNNSWSEIYAPTKYNTSNTAQSTLQGWSKIGDINQTLTINGANGKPMIFVRNMAVTQSGTNLIFTADLSFNHDGLGLPNFERATNLQKWDFQSVQSAKSGD